MEKWQRNEIADAVGAILVLLLFLWIAWVLFSKQIIAWFHNLVISIINGLIALAGLAIGLGIGFFIGWRLEEAGTISAGWGIVITIAIFVILGYFQLGIYGLILVLIDIGALGAFAWKYIDKVQQSGRLLGGM